MARATQLVDRDPRRRMFQPPRVLDRQPEPPASHGGFNGPLGQAGSASAAGVVQKPRTARKRLVSSPEPSVWKSDWPDSETWEPDFWDNESASDDPVHPATPKRPTPKRSRRVSTNDGPCPGTNIGVDATQPEQPTPKRSRLSSSESTPTEPDVTPDFAPRALRIAEAVEHLRVNHACLHAKWRWTRGKHQCEECRHVLKDYIFECRQCKLQACNRCRRNRL